MQNTNEILCSYFIYSSSQSFLVSRMYFNEKEKKTFSEWTCLVYNTCDNYGFFQIVPWKPCWFWRESRGGIKKNWICFFCSPQKFMKAFGTCMVVCLNESAMCFIINFYMYFCENLIFMLFATFFKNFPQKNNWT